MGSAPYKIGDLVELKNGLFNTPRRGEFKVHRVMPIRDNGEHQYRVIGSDGGERAVEHHEIQRTVDPGLFSPVNRHA
jgi:hypothetical protein